jgi:hypothetical protein
MTPVLQSLTPSDYVSSFVPALGYSVLGETKANTALHTPTQNYTAISSPRITIFK